MKKTDYRENEVKEVEMIGRELQNYTTRFYTCHCTGEVAYGILKETMGEQLQYVHTGEEVK